MWKIRSSIIQFAIFNIKVRFQNTYLGITWAALEPLLYFIVLYVVFTAIRERKEDFAIYLITGVMLYHIFTRGTAGGLGSLTTNAGILKGLKIEKVLFPIITTTSALILAFVDVGVFFGLMPVFQFVPSWTIVLLPIPIILLLVLILGLSKLLSIANVFVRDTRHIWMIISHVLLFISPIFWYVDSANDILLTIHSINPLGQLIELSHKLVINGQIPVLSDWLYATLLVFIVYVIGALVFRKFEDRITEEL